VAGFVQLLRIKRGTDAEGEAGVDLGVVGQGQDATVVQFELEYPN
jgi:hypothetical protein